MRIGYPAPMELTTVLFEAGGHAITAAHAALAILGLVLSLLLAAVALAWRAGRTRHYESFEAMRRNGELEVRLAELTGHLRAFADQSASHDAHLARTLDDRLDQVSLRLGQGISETAERTGQSLQALYERLAVIDSAQRNITELSGHMLGLKDILANKQTRGVFGQARMEAIIRDGLHQSAYAFQVTLSNGMRPDCVVRLSGSELKIVIDAKFPLEAFQALKAARLERETRSAEQKVRSDVSRHVKDIAQKYLVAGETHETAILFVPSESIYAELYERFEDVIHKAHRERVILASPNILMLLVQTMQAIFKDARMREQAGQIKTEVMRLMEDVGRLRDRVLDLQKHFGLASQDVEKLVVSSDKIAKRSYRIGELDLEEPPRTAGDGQTRPKLVAERS
jgi:DNA recombination protein RmuC